MKQIHVSKNLEIVGNLETALAVLEMASPELADRVKDIYNELSKEHGVIPLPILTNHEGAFFGEVMEAGDLKFLVMHPSRPDTEILGYFLINLNTQLITKIVIEEE